MIERTSVYSNMDDQKFSPLALEPIEQSTMTELVARRLVGLLSNGNLKPGDKLPPERDLARQLKVGRTTVREALKLLTLSGLLKARRGDGTYVNREVTNFLSHQIEWPVLLNLGDLDMIVEVREALEVKASHLAAERATLEEIDSIAIYQKLMDLECRDFQRETDLDLQFHNAIALASHNPLLVSIMVSLREVLCKYILLSNQLTESIQATIAEHEAIYKAIQAHDPSLAEETMRHHLVISKRVILKTAVYIEKKKHT